MALSFFSTYQKIISGFVIAIAAMGYFLFSTVKSSKENIQDSRLIRYELMMMRSAERLLDDMQDIETAYRGYTITQNPIYLKPKISAKQKIRNDLFELLFSTSFDESEKELANSIKILVVKKISIADTVENLVKSGYRDYAIRIISSNRGLYIMNSIREKIEKLEIRGRLLLNFSNENRMHSASITTVRLLEFTVFVLFLLIIVQYLISKDLRKRKTEELKLLELNQDLLKEVSKKTNEITTIFERISDGFVSLDKENRFIFINNYAEKFLGKKRDEILGQSLITLFSISPESEFRKKLISAINSNIYSEFEELTGVSKRWVSVKVYPTENSTSIFFQDITERKNNEIELIESEKKYRLLFENNPIPMWILDINTRRILDVNEAAIKNYGYSREEFIGKNAIELRGSEDQRTAIQILNSRQTDTFSTGYWTHRRKDGSTLIVEVMAYTLVYENRPARLILSRDVTEKIKAEAELESSRDQLRQLSGHLESIREEERTSIAREIHDELGQQLTGLKMDTAWLSRHIDQNDPMKVKKVGEMMQLIDETVKTVRKIASELRPGILDDLGLISALDWQSREFEKRTGIQCFFTPDSADMIFDKAMSTVIFRIYQEALTNVTRHAEATTVKSFLRIHDQDCIEFTIIDNGKGIRKTPAPPKTLGLIGMKERAMMMNGTLTVESAEGKGTMIKLRIPLLN